MGYNNIADLKNGDLQVFWRSTQVGRRGAPAKGVGRVNRRESSNLSFSAKKFDKFRLVEFFYPIRRLGISSPREAWCISSRAARRPCISSRASVHLTCGLMIYNASH